MHIGVPEKASHQNSFVLERQHASCDVTCKRSTYSLRIAKRLYYERKHEYVKSNTKNTWKILNEVINKKKTTRKLPHELKVNNQMIFNPKLIANRFCDYFTNVGPNLAKTIPKASSTFQSYLDGNFINSLFFEPITEQEIGEIINSLRLLCCFWL